MLFCRLHRNRFKSSLLVLVLVLVRRVPGKIPEDDDTDWSAEEECADPDDDDVDEKEEQWEGGVRLTPREFFLFADVESWL